ncbi:MAG: ABC transporter permease subunit [Chloroflexota bacterium]|nr:ABC transporter permease subunit [Chloroflexota bacterium]
MMQKPTFVSGFPPAMIWVPAVLTALVMILPLGYLVWRTTGSGPDTLDLLMRGKTVAIVIRSVALIVTVTLGSIILSVPLAWLTTRTDLPYKRLWEVLTILPLVVPSYVGGFLVAIALGPKGMLQEFLHDLFGVGRLPEIYGFPGAALTLTFLSYPYVLLTVRGALMRLDPSLEETSRSLGRGQWTTFWRITVPLLRPSIAAGSLLVALYTLSDFGAVSILKYETFTWAIYTQYESVFGRNLASTLSLLLVGVA